MFSWCVDAGASGDAFFSIRDDGLMGGNSAVGLRAPAARARGGAVDGAHFATHGRLILIASEGGVTFWTGNHPLARGEGDLAANPDLKRAELDFRAAHPGLTAEELEPLYYRDAFGHIASDPLWWAGLLARKAFYTVVPAGPSCATLFPVPTASVISYLLLPFSVAGAVALWRSPRRPTALLLLAGASGFACVPVLSAGAFSQPVIDPVLIVCAALDSRD